MTAYNAARYLGEAIDSVVAQETLRPWELLFVDDGSIDDTHAIARAYADKLGGRMRVLQHPAGKNRGISASRNLALRHARGTLIAFLDADDVWLPHHLATQAEVLERHPEVHMAYAGAERWVNFAAPFNEAASRRATWGQNYLPPLVPPGATAGVLDKGSLLNWFLRDESFVPCICTVLVRASVARAVGGFSAEFRGLYDDQVFHAKLSAAYEVYANDRCVARYRQHPVSCCAKARGSSVIAQREQRRFHRFLRLHLSSAPIRAHQQSG